MTTGQSPDTAMLHSILVAVDGSDSSLAAARYGAMLARAFAARLRGIYVIDVRALEGPFFRDLVASTGLIPFQDYRYKIEQLLEEKADAVLAAFAEAVGEQEQGVELEKHMGVVDLMIAKRAHAVDLVVIGARGEHASYRKDLLGSTAEAVVRRCPKPVLLCTESYQPIERPLVCYDGSDRSARVLALAAELAERMELPLRVLTVADSERGGEEILREGIEYLDSTRADYEALVRVGDPGEEIVRCQQEKAVDLLVMGAFGHGRLVHLLLRSVVEEVMRRVNVPLLLTR